MKTFHESLTAWKFAVVGERKGTWPTEMVATSLAEYDAWLKHLASAKIAANQQGISCQFNRSGKGRNMSAWVIANEHAFKITFKQPTRSQAVTATSREAYNTIDFSTQRGQIANVIFSTSQAFGITRKEIEVWYKLGSNQVSGRVNELLEMSEKTPFLFAGRLYRLQVVGTRLSKCEGASNVPNEALRWVEVNQPTETGAQTELNF